MGIREWGQKTGGLPGLTFQGGWNATTNTPALTSGQGNRGDYFVVSVDGATDLDGTTDWKVRDWATFNGEVWQKIDNTEPAGLPPAGAAGGGLGGTYPDPTVDGMTVGVLTGDTAHGVRGGGTQHADVVAAGASGFTTGADKTKLDGISAGATVGDAAAIHDNVDAEISAVAEKLTPVVTDLLLIEDSADSNSKKRVQLANLPGSQVHAQLSSSVDQIPSDTNPIVITFNTQDEIQGVTHSTSVDPGEITMVTSGVYLFILQPQIGKDSGGVKIDENIFLQLDTGSGFADVANTNVILTIKDSDITDVLILSVVQLLAAGDKIRCMQKVSATGSGIGLKATAAVVGPPTVPATPSIIFSMFKIA